MNLWNEFQALIPKDPISYGEVLSHSDGTSRVALPSGAEVVAEGAAVEVGGYVWMQAGRITGEAPGLPGYSVDV
jgi:hypothetical protein